MDTKTTVSSPCSLSNHTHIPMSRENKVEEVVHPLHIDIIYIALKEASKRDSLFPMHNGLSPLEKNSEARSIIYILTCNISEYDCQEKR